MNRGQKEIKGRGKKEMLCSLNGRQREERARRENRGIKQKQFLSSGKRVVNVLRATTLALATAHKVSPPGSFGRCRCRRKPFYEPAGKRKSEYDLRYGSEETKCWQNRFGDRTTIARLVIRSTFIPGTAKSQTDNKRNGNELLGWTLNSARFV